MTRAIHPEPAGWQEAVAADLSRNGNQPKGLRRAGIRWDRLGAGPGPGRLNQGTQGLFHSVTETIHTLLLLL